MNEFQQAGLAIVVALVWLVMCWLLWRKTRKFSILKRWSGRLGVMALALVPLLFGVWLLTMSAQMDRAPRTASMESEQPAASESAVPPAPDAGSANNGFANQSIGAPKAKRAYRRQTTETETAAPGVAVDGITTGSIPESFAPDDQDQADLGGDAGTALEEQVAELEATTPVAREMVAPAPVARDAAPEAKPMAEASRSLAPPPPSPPAANGGPTASPFGGTDDYAAVPIFYGTDRQENQAVVARVAYTGERANRLELGRAVVTVPKLNRSLGQVTRPREITFMGIKVYSEAEDPKRHFTIQEIAVMSEEDYLAKVREQLANSRRFKDQAIVFVHGYNVTFDSALYRTAQIAYDLEFDGVPFLYSWPSRGALTEYEYDQNSSVYARDYLKQFLDLVVERTGAKHVHLVAHSMGNVPLLEALREYSLSADAEVARSKINQIILAAPDVDRNGFIAIAERIKSLGQGVTLYASSTDKAMQASRTYAGGVPRAGDVPADGPIVITGMDTIDVSAMSTEFLGLNHSTYAEKSELLRDMGQMLLLGLRPPEKRLTVLEPITTANGGTFWRVKP